MDLGPGELAIILVIVLLLFGGKKLPELARSLGQAKKEFESAGSDTASAPASGGAPDHAAGGGSTVASHQAEGSGATGAAAATAADTPKDGGS